MYDIANEEAAMDEMEDQNICGTWECPICGEDHSDPNYINFTQCRNGHSVVLTVWAEQDGDDRGAVSRPI